MKIKTIAEAREAILDILNQQEGDLNVINLLYEAILELKQANDYYLGKQ